ncbi:sugar phosphate isomerase/epimerase family protein [Microbacterium testaceum]|uniref:Xylose isomerase n=1 Tax=Microbacterium testaceum TaxID=2033 RepID=A0A147F8A6_MICTE|nr:sugar phosphate isomerase/epimerase [Microbacterium testaceum]KTS12507.1 xylose isomerase [Microbacterium testaceum]
MSLSPRVICSTITLRYLPLEAALRQIVQRGFTGIDLGALPGVCDHVPYDLTPAAVAEVASTIADSGLSVISVNGDIGDLNVPMDADGAAARARHADLLLDLAARVGARALVLPNGRLDHEPVRDLESDLDLVAAELSRVDERARERGLELWVEAPHWFRFAYDLDRSGALLDRLPASIGVVCDVSHITAGGSTPRVFLDRFADRVRHVHIRDAARGDIHRSVGKGEVDFGDLAVSLAEHGYDGSLALELETRDVADDDRADAALTAGLFISTQLDAAASVAGGVR